MSRDDNLQIIGALYEAFGRGDAETILAHLTDDVDWAADAADAGAPWHGVRTGKDAVGRFFGEIAGAIEVLYFRFRDGKVDYYRGSEDTALTASVLSGSRSPAQTAAIA